MVHSKTAPLLKIPTGSGSGTITFQLVDGTDATAEIGERVISFGLNLDWSGDGTSATFTVPAQVISGTAVTSGGTVVEFELERHIRWA